MWTMCAVSRTYVCLFMFVWICWFDVSNDLPNKGPWVLKQALAANKRFRYIAAPTPATPAKGIANFWPNCSEEVFQSTSLAPFMI